MKPSKKIDELLCTRSLLQRKLNAVNNLIDSAMDYCNNNHIMPDRWYVLNPNVNVLHYLEDKYDIDLSLDEGCGYGEIHGEVAFVPKDVEYDWKISQKEFDKLYYF